MFSTTLCYVEKDGCYLMLHRVKKQGDLNKDKWIGLGGKLEEGESPEDCVLREVREESGLTLTDYRYRGLVTFVSDEWGTEWMHLFTATDFVGELIPCDEGNLEWVPLDKVNTLHLWEGDKIFLKLLQENTPFFSLKLVYQGDTLTKAVLNGETIRGEGGYCGKREKFHVCKAKTAYTEKCVFSPFFAYNFIKFH